MKKYFGLFFLLGLFLFGLSSCTGEREDDDNEMDEMVEENSEDLNNDEADLQAKLINYPSMVDDYVVQNFSGMAIENVSILANGNLKVKLSDGKDLLFGPDGNFLE